MTPELVPPTCLEAFRVLCADLDVTEARLLEALHTCSVPPGADPLDGWDAALLRATTWLRHPPGGSHAAAL